MLKGSGTIFGDLTLGSNATLAPGFSPGSLTISGNMNMNANSVLTVELGGSVPGTTFDYVNVMGTANLAGVLNVTSYNNYVPTGGTSYRFMNFAAARGSFAAVNLPVGWNISLVAGSNYFDLLAAASAAISASTLPPDIALTPDAVAVMLTRAGDTATVPDVSAAPRQQLVSVEKPIEEEACP